MYIIVIKETALGVFEVIRCDTPQEVHKRTAMYEHDEYIVMHGELLKDVDDVVIKRKGKRPWTVNNLL